MLATRLKRLCTTLILSLAIAGGPLVVPSSGLTSTPSPDQPSSFIRCEESNGGTCDDQCEGDISKFCGTTATCCARQYYENGECDDAYEDNFTCYGNPEPVEATPY